MLPSFLSELSHHLSLHNSIRLSKNLYRTMTVSLQTTEIRDTLTHFTSTTTTTTEEDTTMLLTSFDSFSSHSEKEMDKNAEETDIYAQQALQNHFVYNLLLGKSCLPKSYYQQGYWSQQTTLKTEKDLVDGLDCGEDAFFITQGPRYCCLGVADGVGGWNQLGVNPALFARELMACSKVSAESQPHPMPWDVMEEAYRSVQTGGKVTAGSSTACLLTFDKWTGHLHSSNLGDSGFLLFRLQPKGYKSKSEEEAGWEVVHSSKESQHYFNAPFQLAILPGHLTNQQRAFFMSDQPKDAINSSFTNIKHGDVLVIATDGLFDNLFPEDIARLILSSLEHEILRMQKRSNERLHPNGTPLSSSPTFPDHLSDTISDRSSSDQTPVPMNTEDMDIEMQESEWLEMMQNLLEKTADTIVKEAAYMSMSPRRSPFEKEAAKHGWNNHQGGKVDDITVITGLVVAKEREMPMALL